MPGLDDDVDIDDSLVVGFDWLKRAERKGQPGIVVMFAKSMVGHRPLLARAASRWQFVSPRSERPRRYGPVLAIWPPDARVLEFAESLAIDRSLCVIAGHHDIRPWIQKAEARCVIEDWKMDAGNERVPQEVADELDQMLMFDGHNGFVGAGGKEHAIQTLRRIAQLKNPPQPEAIEGHLVVSGDTSAKGATRARQWYEEILQGKRHRGYRGRLIE